MGKRNEDSEHLPDTLAVVEREVKSLAKKEVADTLAPFVELSHEVHNIETGHFDKVNSIALSADNRYVYTGSHDGTVKVWDTATGVCLRTLDVGLRLAGVRVRIALNADGRRLVTASGNKTARLWNLDTGTCIQEFRHPVGVHSVAFSADGHYLATGSDDGNAMLWDISTGSCVRTFDQRFSKYFKVNSGNGLG